MKHLQRITLIGAKTTFVEVWRWGQELERLHARIASRFARPEPRRLALAFLKGIVRYQTFLSLHNCRTVFTSRSYP